MNNRRSPSWYRAEATRCREQAIATADSTALRDSYLALTVQYERLAAILEKSTTAPAEEPAAIPKPQSRARSGS